MLLLPPGTRWPEADRLAVVDALRATTMIAMLLHRGARSVIAAAEERIARRLAAGQAGAVLAGEVGGLPPPGFDLGNSPSAVSAEAVAGRDVVLFTTNGTRALCSAAAQGQTAAAAAVNASAAARWLANGNRAVIVCAGEARGTSFALEDFAGAACIVARLPRLRLGDGALLTQQLADPAALISASRHAEELRRLELSADIAVAQQVDLIDLVPVVVERGDGWVRLEATRA
ncbi:MAG: putative 2-phosphosulfolactate phosphatase [Tepidiforma sp.]|nr:MAG: putative 2-phosphosulfolactate phosphatase [Tepidiforma sp.]